MRIWVMCLMSMALAACASDPHDPCGEIGEGEVAACADPSERAVCDGEIRCSFNPDGLVTGRTFTQAVCVDALPDCAFVCMDPERSECSNTPE